MEGELSASPRFPLHRCLALLLFLLVALPSAVAQPDDEQPPFHIVLLIPVWKRPRLTRFTLLHFAAVRDAELAPHGIRLDLFLVGSDATETAAHAEAVGAAGHLIHANNPVGAKHNAGLRAIRDHYGAAVAAGTLQRVPHAVAVFGSDDVANAAYFRAVRARMAPPDDDAAGHPYVTPRHFVGVRDIFFTDVRTRRLVYTRGYKTAATPMAATVGCGRAFSWAALDAADWTLWDDTRDRGLDQSAVRNVLRRVVLLAEVSDAFVGRDAGIALVDVKSDGFASGGANMWSFDSVVKAGDGSGRLHRFVEQDRNATLRAVFGASFVERLERLRHVMEAEEGGNKSAGSA